MNRHTIYAVIDSDFNLVVWRFWLRLPNLMYTNTAHNYVYYKAMYTQHRPLCQTKISVSVHNKKLHVLKQYFDRDGCRVRDYPAKALHVDYDCSIRIYWSFYCIQIKSIMLVTSYYIGIMVNALYHTELSVWSYSCMFLLVSCDFCI